MLRELDEVEHVFPQLVLRLAIARIRTSLPWAADVDGEMGELERSRARRVHQGARLPWQPVT